MQCFQGFAHPTITGRGQKTQTVYYMGVVLGAFGTIQISGCRVSVGFQEQFCSRGCSFAPLLSPSGR